MTDNSQILFKIAQDVGHLVGTMDAMKETLESHANENADLKKKVENLEQAQQRVKWTVFGLSLGGAFTGTKLPTFLEILFK
jgi:hypothetical protein